MATDLPPDIRAIVVATHREWPKHVDTMGLLNLLHVMAMKIYAVEQTRYERRQEELLQENSRLAAAKQQLER